MSGTQKIAHVWIWANASAWIKPMKREWVNGVKILPRNNCPVHSDYSIFPNPVIPLLSRDMCYLILTQYFGTRNWFEHIPRIHWKPHKPTGHILINYSPPPAPCYNREVMFDSTVVGPAHLWEHCTSSFLQFSHVSSCHVILTSVRLIFPSLIIFKICNDK